MQKLPIPVAGYFAATNKHDIPAILASFLDDAVVQDEGQQHRGLDAIGKWASETIRKYDFTVEPADVTEANHETVVTAVVSGTFPGSPLRLRYKFLVDGNGIRRLEIV